MTATWKREYAGMSGSATVANERRYVVRGRVVTDSDDYTIPDIALVQGVPKKYDPFGPEDLGALCIKLDIEQDRDNQRVWRVSAEYSTIHGDPAQENQPNPLLRPALWTYDSVESTVASDFDWQGNPYQNAAGDPFTNAPENAHSTSRYTVTQNIASFSGDQADYYANTVNADTWYGKAPATVRCRGITAKENWGNEYHYWTRTITIEIDRNGWQPKKIANKGYSVLTSGNKMVDMGRLVWLNSFGGLWVEGTHPASDKYILRYPFETRNFADLNV